MGRFWITALMFAVAVAAAPGAQAQCAVGSLQFENDIGIGGTDRHYTHGTRFSCISEEQAPTQIPHRVADALSFDAFGIPMLDTGGEVRYTLALGQTMFTPEDITRYDLISDDRPYAGWLFGTFGLVLGPRWRAHDSSAAFDRMETLEFTIGVVGPSSGAEETQKFVHSAIGSQYPEGWHNQLKDEPGLMLSYEHKWRTEQWNLLPFSDLLQIDLMPSVGATLGNVHTFGSAAFTFRIGSNLHSDFGPPRIRPSVAGSEYYDPGSDAGLSSYFFVSFGGRAVERNIFLDGNTFRSSHSVNKKHFVGDVQAGVVVSLWGEARLSLTHIYRTREFDGQDEPDQFSAFSLSMRF